MKSNYKKNNDKTLTYSNNYIRGIAHLYPKLVYRNRRSRISNLDDDFKYLPTQHLYEQIQLKASLSDLKGGGDFCAGQYCGFPWELNHR